MPVIKVQDASIYQRETEVLKNVSFEVNEGEFVYLIGKTGMGKSSLLKTLFAELPLTNGQIEVLEQSLTKIKKKKILALRRRIGIVFQDFQLLQDRTVKANLLFVLKATGWYAKSEMEERIQKVIQQVGLQGSEDKMPHRLSGGEQQRVAIARALLNDPELIIADEPTGNLDPETTTEIMNLLFQIAKEGKSVFMATHEYEMIQKFPSRTLKVEDNTLNEVNLFDEFKNQ